MRVASWATRTTLVNTRRRIDGLDYYAQKFMMHHGLAKHRRSIWAGFLDGTDMQASILVSPHTFVWSSQRVGKRTSGASAKNSKRLVVPVSRVLA